jgi:hypothetical protein
LDGGSIPVEAESTSIVTKAWNIMPLGSLSTGITVPPGVVG